ncbi:hypothetical protein [Paenibacillus naphthalenovorans]|uniref:Uncharacterized protein n=1 Tax=Paenibacillus naphthalenovorans TaxID=162209 RepID=A0A0U2VN19_9BACL|nr:hypothetical protein [Paenibacillus naphthalenovorans]ALS22118.1 hypothetical protein IJ22_17440 [Paenibacillus naphthalenovorans]
MLFWTIVFFTISLIGLIKGGLFSSLKSRLKQIELKKLNGGDEKEYVVEWLKAGCFPLIVVSFLFIAEVLYLVNALDYDPYKFPTITAIAILIIGIIKTKKSKKSNDMTEEELIVYKAELVKKDKRTFMSVIRSFLWVVYFGYMFYVLVF